MKALGLSTKLSAETLIAMAQYLQAFISTMQAHDYSGRLSGYELKADARERVRLSSLWLLRPKDWFGRESCANIYQAIPVGHSGNNDYDQRAAKWYRKEAESASQAGFAYRVGKERTYLTMAQIALHVVARRLSTGYGKKQTVRLLMQDLSRDYEVLPERAAAFCEQNADNIREL